MAERESPKPEIKKTQVDTLANLLSNAENITALHGHEFAEVFSSDESIRSFIEGLDEVAFIELINSINGIIQGKDKKEWTMAKGLVPLTTAGKGGSHGYTPPHAQDRQMLFSEVLKAMQEMTRDKKSLEDVAILLSSSINAIHAYEDGNGRTSRLLYFLLTKRLNEETKPIIQQAVSEDGRDIINVNPGKIESELSGILQDRMNLKRTLGVWESEKEKKDITFGKNLPHDLKSELLAMLSDELYSSIALHQYLNDEPDADQYLKYYPQREASWHPGKILPERNNVMVDKLFSNVDEEQARRILSIYRQIKADMIRILIDSISHPEKAVYYDEDDKTILEKFRHAIKHPTENWI